jgi:hypothetical protein
MKKVRINTTLRHKLETYVRSQIDAGIDKTPLERAKIRLRQEALRLAVAAYPEADMQILATYGKASRYDRFTFTMPDGEAESFEFSQDLPYDLPGNHGYRFDPAIPADAAFAATAQEVAAINAALRAEAKRQWEQAAILVNCALYFEDVLDYLRIPESERVNLSRRWHLPVEQAEPQPQAADEDDAAEEEADSGEEAPATDAPRLLVVLGGAVETAEAEQLQDAWWYPAARQAVNQANAA